MNPTSSTATTYGGRFALQNASARANARLLVERGPRGELSRHLDFSFMRPHTRVPLRAYAIDMTKYAHVIIVSDDFTTFAHVHPHLETDGRFVLDQTFPHAGLYHIYADIFPIGIGHQAFRFDVPIGDVRKSHVGATERTSGPHTLVQSSAPYTVRLDTARVRARHRSLIHLEVFEDDRPARALRPYLGTAAHAVILDANDLSYAHVHPTAAGEAMHMDGGDMSMHEMPMPAADAYVAPRMILEVNLAEPGAYRMWLQFRDATRVHTVSFIIDAAA